MHPYTYNHSMPKYIWAFLSRWVRSTLRTANVGSLPSACHSCEVNAKNGTLTSVIWLQRYCTTYKCIQNMFRYNNACAVVIQSEMSTFLNALLRYGAFSSCLNKGRFWKNCSKNAHNVFTNRYYHIYRVI